ncbi:3-dehydroquinate synthase [Chlorobium sp. N1]|uniref:3-dehydroquinate synthase n=1 Tax=Chlorobium sp. N1 TaxID=2491138 RepID=UPI00103CD898|nr:3-dehydroquinate synthase [Chlorobium sp. N1]TCD48578.1 3-dehydroquinate synthase [Chlorobium sp. N1]
MSTIIVSGAATAGLRERFRAHGLKQKTVVLFDTNTRKLFGEKLLSAMKAEGFTVLELTVPSRENSKSFSTAFKLYGRMIEAGVDRSWNLLAVGGGVVGDLGGFIAASYYRGIPVIQLPTTLLAMTDSSIGGKVAVNHPLGKNLIGFFHLPELVLIDPSYLRTLPAREIYSGLSEVVKYGFIADRAMFERLDEHFEEVTALEEPYLTEAVRRSAEIKEAVVEADFREMSGLRATLNFGHTFAHGLEKLADYRFIRHGEAVTIGMACALSLSNHLGYLDEASLERGLALIRKFRFPRGLVEKRFLSIEAPVLLENMLSDKKKLDSRLRFVLLRALGEAFLLEEDVEDREVLRAIESAKDFFRNPRSC